MIDSAGDREPFLVGRARELNEYLPVHVGRDRRRAASARVRGATQGARLAVLGWAYKGWPPTDDMRGTPIADDDAGLRRGRASPCSATTRWSPTT